MIKTATERYKEVPCGPECHVGSIPSFILVGMGKAEKERAIALSSNHAIGCLNDRQQHLEFRGWLRDYEKSGAVWGSLDERQFEEIFAAGRAYQRSEDNRPNKGSVIIPEPVYVCHKCKKEFSEAEDRVNSHSVSGEKDRKYQCNACFDYYIKHEYVGCPCGSPGCSGR